MENLDMFNLQASSILKRDNKGLSVRRCLFGPVDHEENSRFLKEQLKIQEQECCNKWNFDFVTMTPLNGKYDWEPVNDCEIPAAYELKHMTKPTPSRARTPLGLSSRLNSNLNALPREQDTPTMCSSINILRETVPVVETESCACPKSSQPVKGGEKTKESYAPVSRSPLKRKLYQRDITDFFPAKKHRSAFQRIIPSKTRQTSQSAE